MLDRYQFKGVSMSKQTQVPRKAIPVVCYQSNKAESRKDSNGRGSQKLVQLNSLAEKYFSSRLEEKRRVLRKMIEAISCLEDAENLRLILKKKGGAHAGSVDSYINIRCREIKTRSS